MAAWAAVPQSADAAKARSERYSYPEYRLGRELRPHVPPPVRLKAHLGYSRPDAHLLPPTIRSDLGLKGKAVKEQLHVVLLEDQLAV